MITRRALLAAPLLSLACGRRRGTGFRGYAFVANEESQSIAVVDLEALAVARHIPLDGAPSQVIMPAKRPSIFSLAASTGTIQQIDVDRLSPVASVKAASSAVTMQMATDDTAIYVLARDPKSLARVSLNPFKVEWRIALPEEPVNFALTSDAKTAVVATRSGIRFVDLIRQKLQAPLGNGDFGALAFLSDSKTMIAANRGEKRLSLFDVPSSQLLTHLPLSVRPDYMCFNRDPNGLNTDGGQLFVTGEGMDAVVVVFPYHTPEVAETVLSGHSPGPMAASRQFLFVANPGSSDVSILDIASRKMIAVVSVGTDPNFIAVTPDDQYALVLNRTSGDVSVLRTGTITRNRDRRAAVLTAIPVGSRPVSAVVRPV